MTNPADVLTDEFIERVTKTLISRVFYQRDPREWIRSEKSLQEVLERDIRAVLREEREPIHRLVFEVRAPNRQSALNRLNQAISDSEVGARSDIRLIIEQDEP